MTPQKLCSNNPLAATLRDIMDEADEFGLCYQSMDEDEDRSRAALYIAEAIDKLGFSLVSKATGKGIPW